MSGASRIWYGGLSLGSPLERVAQSIDDRTRQNVEFTEILVGVGLMCRCGLATTRCTAHLTDGDKKESK